MNQIKYRGFIIEYIPCQTITREDENGETVECKGAVYFVYGGDEKLCEVDTFSAAEGFELPDDSAENIEMFAREMVDAQYKEYIRKKENV